MTTPSTTKVSPGDVMLVLIPFSDGSGAKFRPVVVVSTDRYHAERADAIVIPVTSNLSSLRAGDFVIDGWREAGLKRPSATNASLRSVDRRGLGRRLGRLAPADAAGVGGALRAVLAL